MNLATPKTFNFDAWNRLLVYLAGDQVNTPVSRLAQSVLIPAAALLVFLMLWSVGAKNVETSLGQLPGPAQVWEQTANLVPGTPGRNGPRKPPSTSARKKRNDKADRWPASRRRPCDKIRPAYTGKPTFFDQILTSLLTVVTGFLLGLADRHSDRHPDRPEHRPCTGAQPDHPAVQTGVAAGLAAAGHHGGERCVRDQDPLFQKSFLTSAITVTLCCLWPTVINTAVGVSSA